MNTGKYASVYVIDYLSHVYVRAHSFSKWHPVLGWMGCVAAIIHRTLLFFTANFVSLGIIVYPVFC